MLKQVLISSLIVLSLTTGQQVLEAAKSMKGFKYSYGGGGKSGPTHGKLQKGGRNCDDSKVKGFDCSGLALYAVYKGCGVSLKHGATSQYKQAKSAGKLFPYSQAQPGDLLFFGSKGDIRHVAIYSRAGKMWEAKGHNDKCEGLPVMESSIRKTVLPEVAIFC